MDDIAGVCKRFSGTFAGGQMDALRKIYQELEPESQAFSSRFSISCPPGCGTCCEHFIPDITQTEARLVAAWMLLNARGSHQLQALEDWTPEADGCPLYDPDTPYHCTIYPARPLICRLFAACASQGKNGAQFRKCRFNTDTTTPMLIDGPTLEASGAPVMQDYAYQVHSLDRDGQVELLPEAVLTVMDELRFVLAALGDDDGPDNSNPDDTPTPTPLAS